MQTILTEFIRNQRLVCFGIIGAMRTTPTVLIDGFLDLAPLYLVILRKSRMKHLRLQELPSNRYIGFRTQ